MIADLRVIYDGGEINRELDDALIALLADFGLTCWASGFDLANDKRDLAFEMTEGKDGPD